MASSTAASSQPLPLRSPEDADVDLCHPTPDLQALQGAYIGNIERLEEHAERMSEHGSDLGEEIRKLQQEQKLSDSRRSSLYSAPPVEEPTRQFRTRSRNASTSSYTNSIVDVVGAARCGGYSPGGYLTSPVGSLRSGSFSLPQPSTQRQRSGSRTSRLGQVMHTELHDTPQTVAEQPASPPAIPRSAPRDSSPPPSGRRSVSSFSQKYDQIAQEIHNELQHSARNSRHMEDGPQPRYDDHRPNPSNLELPDRPPTAASTDTTHQARTLWQDFDGVHCPDTVPEEEPVPSHGSGSRDSSMLKPAPEMTAQGAPPPDDNMVFYPAPVPKMLNLPKRLSQMPAANVQARRRTQLLETMQTENRKSAAWLPDEVPQQTIKPVDPRKSRQSLMNLPPQLRASAYFDQAGPTQEFEVKGESAEVTLDHILEASAHAPVSAFTDHPFAGQVGNEVYGIGKEHVRKGSKTTEWDKADARKSRSSINLLDTRRNSSGDLLNKLKKRNSSGDLNMLTVRATESRMSLGTDLDDLGPEPRGPEAGNGETPLRQSFDEEPNEAVEDELAEQQDEEEAEEQYFGAPTTLLAELQMRKQQQKSRNLTAATAFPNGMHSTLLQLDAVAEIEKKKRKGQKVNLAWEAQIPMQELDDDSEDDVPLGVLFPGGSQQYLTVPTTMTPQPESEDDEGETLAQRVRRLKNRQTLDNALGAEVRKSTVSGDFAAEMMSQFGMPEGEGQTKPEQAEEETLGQRRARLQAEALARGDVNPLGSRPPLRASLSMADILSAHPIDPTNQARKVSDEQLLSSLPQGSLLHLNAVKQERTRATRLDQNKRMSSYNTLDQPLLGGDVGKTTEDQPIAARIQAYKDKLAGATPPSAPPTYGAQTMNGMTPSMSMTNLPGQRGSYFPSQSTMGMPNAPFGMANGFGMPPGNINMMPPQMMPMNMNMMGMPIQGMQGMQYPYQQMGAMGGMRQSSMLDLPMAMQMQQNPVMMMMGPPMDPRQRDQIDRWRQSIMH
ncbi:hypothetical protein BDV95DRAFT_487871 [Massariosphaeria phaeospora]|uniref:Uncharacterized protein n=1 Tax=Massariosphaeria phaeospora TaxID=100035 RepID=A0A7C8MJ16_9PLEO|nr:hypothetical protein BDV95DRAFT_487871 [Massariosphaeria phaeospora]